MNIEHITKNIHEIAKVLADQMARALPSLSEQMKLGVTEADFAIQMTFIAPDQSEFVARLSIEKPDEDNETVHDSLDRALKALHDFREFTLDNATQWKSGAGTSNPIWPRVAEILNKHGMQSPPHGRKYHEPDVAYFCGN